ncbi:MAG: site-specific DNA-methyltransferase [Candidatus Sericytochromatia bacterium]|nr:site-specific DNA-methyltransferase [Candidatus Sericytochromatia bacterium]
MSDDAAPFGLRWPGDAAARASVDQAAAGALRPRHALAAPDAPHTFIEGDNLPVMQHLSARFAGQVRIAYLDPPYNTGVAMRYHDRFQTDARRYAAEHGAAARGARHAAWLSFMWPRLAMVHRWLADDGVLFISIDDRESHHLRLLLDEIFGEENFVSTITWRKKVVRGRGARHVLPQTEYIHVYARRLAALPPFEEPLTDAMREAYDAVDARGPYKRIPLAKSGTAHSARPNLVYVITAPDGSPIPCPSHQWRWSRETLAARQDELEFLKGRDGRWRVYTKQRLVLPDGERGRTPLSYYDRVTTADGTRELKGLFGRPVIDFPKPIQLIKDLLTWATPRGDRRDALILDPFAGSCPTAQAVLELNAADGGARRFLCIQAPEAIPDSQFATLADVGQARIDRISARLALPPETVASWRWEPADQGPL